MIFEELIEKAKTKNASDVHFKVGEYPKYRLPSGIINDEDYDKISSDEIFEIYDYLIAGNIDLDKRYKEERYLDLSFKVNDVRLRVNMSFAVGNPVITARLIKDELPLFEELGLPDIVRKMVYVKQGLILVTGKTNSGKSTTLNSLIDDINKNAQKKIITLEDPIEYLHTSNKAFIVQKEVGPR